MRILFAISLVALAALLWASVSIAQHVYRSRRRQRSAPKASRGSIEKLPPSAAGRAPRASEDGHQQRKAS